MHTGKKSKRELGSLYQHIVLLMKAVPSQGHDRSKIEEIGKEKKIF